MTTQTHQAAPGWYDDGSGRQRWWDGTQWTTHYANYQPVQYMQQPAVIVEQRKTYKTSHGFHLVMSIITVGFWLPVWLIVGIYNASKS